MQLYAGQEIRRGPDSGCAVVSLLLPFLVCDRLVSFFYNPSTEISNSAPQYASKRSPAIMKLLLPTKNMTNCKWVTTLYHWPHYMLKHVVQIEHRLNNLILDASKFNGITDYMFKGAWFDRLPRTTQADLQALNFFQVATKTRELTKITTVVAHFMAAASYIRLIHIVSPSRMFCSYPVNSL